MAKNILIFSDGTGQIGGMRPDQRLSNVYKMYRAMRPGPSSPIKPAEQVAFYDPGLGAGEVDGMTFRRIRHMLEAAVGTGIDENVIDCYENIIAQYEPRDRVFLFGFSRGAYTVRSVANVMNLCGIPTKMPDGTPIPKYGPKLRKIASDAVRFVYNHGAGFKRGKEPYYTEREEKGRRFRKRYSSADVGEKALEQGNVQPTFIGVFDTVAALGNKIVNWVVYGFFLLVAAALIFSIMLHWPWHVTLGFAVLTAIISYWLLVVLKSQFKYFSPDPNHQLRLANPRDWRQILKHCHWASWSRKNYDGYLDPDVRHARHALSIDETRADFPRVIWGRVEDAKATAGRKPDWLKQVWFAGCHSDIGGSYPEPESRLSDIALRWMIKELKECAPDIKIRNQLLVTSPDPLALQHEEVYIFKKGPFSKRWPVGPREVTDLFPLHQSVLKRLSADAVPQTGEVKPYRPEQLAGHKQAAKFFKKQPSGEPDSAISKGQT